MTPTVSRTPKGRSLDNRKRVELRLSLTKWKTVEEIWLGMFPPLTRGTIHRHLMHLDNIELRLRSSVFDRKQIWEYRLKSGVIKPQGATNG